jgi:hypothetical protein
LAGHASTARRTERLGQCVLNPTVEHSVSLVNDHIGDDEYVRRTKGLRLPVNPIDQGPRCIVLLTYADDDRGRKTLRQRGVPQVLPGGVKLWNQQQRPPSSKSLEGAIGGVENQPIVIDQEEWLGVPFLHECSLRSGSNIRHGTEVPFSDQVTAHYRDAVPLWPAARQIAGDVLVAFMVALFGLLVSTDLGSLVFLWWFAR